MKVLRIRSNGLRRLEGIGKNGSYDFGFLDLGTDAQWSPRLRRINIFSIYKRRALKRLSDLNSKLGGRGLADYFYHENRCGIAHGGPRTKEYDFKHNIEEISKDVYIMKLLSRMAVEDKMREKPQNSNARGVNVKK